MARGTFVNEVRLAGQLVVEPRAVTIEVKGKDGQPRAMQIVNSTLWVRARTFFGRRESNRVPIKFYGQTAAHAIRLELSKGDWIYVSGRLDFRSKKASDRTQTFFHVVVEDFQALWPPPSRFVGGHCIIPADEYNRLKLLVESAGLQDFDVPESVLASLDMLPAEKLPKLPQYSKRRTRKKKPCETTES